VTWEKWGAEEISNITLIPVFHKLHSTFLSLSLFAVIPAIARDVRFRFTALGLSVEISS